MTLEIYLAALAGLAVFYGLERAVRGSRARRAATEAKDQPEPHVFWLHVGSFALYNVLIGYLLLHREGKGYGSLALYAIAMAFHFMTNDFGLRQDYKTAYDRAARWLLAAGTLGGWALGAGRWASPSTFRKPPSACSSPSLPAAWS